MTTRTMKIGELARRTNKTVRALHLYEELGLLSAARSEGGFRLYGEAEVKRVLWINTLQDMGFKLAQIRDLLDTVRRSASAPNAMDSVRGLFQRKLAETRRQVEYLLRLERDIAESMAYLEACRSCDEASSHACANCDSNRHSLPAPSLVTGIHLVQPFQASAPAAHPPQPNQPTHPSKAASSQ
jgi:DNA-binding transcriptional MerR regulator